MTAGPAAEEATARPAARSVTRPRSRAGSRPAPRPAPLPAPRRSTRPSGGSAPRPAHRRTATPRSLDAAWTRERRLVGLAGRSAARSARHALRQALHLLWRLVVQTVSGCLRHRVTGLAAEAAFFTVLSVPPLLFALAGAIGYVTAQFDPHSIDQIRQAVLDFSNRFLTDRAVAKIIRPTLNDVLRGGRFDVISVGFVLALWSGSRALNVFIDTITIMHGLGGARGIIKARALSFTLYVMALVTGVVTIPLLVAGPDLVASTLPSRFGFVLAFYWPVVALVSICFLATLYHVSVPQRSRWRFNLPGAVFTLVAWIAGSYLLRLELEATAADSRSIYGPLAAPIAVLLWLYLVSIAVLIGAAVNAAFALVLDTPDRPVADPVG